MGGNIDRDGYNRTADAFRKDLEFYYSKGYRMVRLVDYVNGKIDVSYGKSPLVLTFDDGNSNNIRVTGLDSNEKVAKVVKYCKEKGIRFMFLGNHHQQ